MLGSIRQVPQHEIGATATNRTVRTAASNHALMSPPNEQQTPTKRIGGEDGPRVTGRDGGLRTHTKLRDGHQKDYQSLSLNGGEAAKDVMILSL